MCDGFVIIFIFKYIHIFILAELSYDCKGQKRQKTHETGENTGYAGTVEMYQDGGTKLVKFNSWGLFEYEK